MRDIEVSRPSEMLIVMKDNEEVPVVNPTTIIPTVPTLGRQPIRVSDHAVQRYRERIDPGASPVTAFWAIRDMLASGVVRTTPHWWTTCRLEPGQRLVYSATRADACLVVNNDVVVTVLSRDLCAPARRRRAVPRSASNRRWELPQDLYDVDIYEPLPADLAMVA